MKSKSKIKMDRFKTILFLWWILWFRLTTGQCPWPRTPLHASLHSDCVCGYSNVRRLSVQCSPMANFSQLLEVLHSPSVQRLPIDLLYVNNVTGLNVLPKNAFRKLDIQQIHLTNTRLDSIERGAFSGLEDKLISLTLQNIGLKEVPVSEIRHLRSLHTLDLSNNRIRRIKEGTFHELNQLSTLRLAFNDHLQLDHNAFSGVERSLKNLNLKSIGIRQIPEAIQNLTELAFLDLAQNKLEEIRPRIFENFHLLTALSLERNMIRTLHPNTFTGLNESLSSLSLLNNHLVEFPQLALSQLAGLRVLDLGFNAIRVLPTNSFKSNRLLTLLALDGNPLKTLSHRTFAHLNSTLRGISIGGKLFECDCKVRWLAEWSLEYSLQISSRERNPQFCGKPAHLRNKPFTHIDLNDFVCPPLAVTSNGHQNKPHNSNMYQSVTTPRPISTSSSEPRTTLAPTSTVTPVYIAVSSKTTSTTTMTPITSPTPQYRTKKPFSSYVNEIPVEDILVSSTTSTTSTTTSTHPPITTTAETPYPLIVKKANVTRLAHGTPQVISVDFEPFDDFPQVRRFENINRLSSQSNRSHSASLKLIDAVYRNYSVVLRWEALRPSIKGYQVVYRYFGSKEYFRSEPISGRIYNHTLANYIAPNELIVICVVSLDDHDNVLNFVEKGDNEQCRELTTKELIIKKPIQQRTNTPSPSPNTPLSSLHPSLRRLNDIDKIVIAISATVCIFIIVAVLVFSCCFYRSSSKDSPLRTMTTNATCLSTKSLSPITKSLDQEWETMSVYSTRSIPRARIANLLSHPTGQLGPYGRYFGSTLPSKSGSRAGWLEAYMHHYPTISHIPAISYGTTVTATGGGNNGPAMYEYQSDCYRNGLGTIPKDNCNKELPFTYEQYQHRARKPKTRSKSHRQPDHRTSSNRLLLSSSSNSYQSQNEYDSDNWLGNNYGTNGNSNNTKPKRFVGRMNDNEVDIYIDQNYARRFY